MSACRNETNIKQHPVARGLQGVFVRQHVDSVSAVVTYCVDLLGILSDSFLTF